MRCVRRAQEGRPTRRGVLPPRVWPLRWRRLRACSRRRQAVLRRCRGSLLAALHRALAVAVRAARPHTHRPKVASQTPSAELLLRRALVGTRNSYTKSLPAEPLPKSLSLSPS